MALTFFNPDTVPGPVGLYSLVAEVPAGARLIYISGQTPVRKDGTWPSGFAEQADQVFANIVAILEARGLKPTDLVKLTTYIVETDGQPEAYGAARVKHLGDHRPSVTGVFIAGLVNPEWKIEVEAIAAVV